MQSYVSDVDKSSPDPHVVCTRLSDLADLVQFASGAKRVLEMLRHFPPPI